MVRDTPRRILVGLEHSEEAAAGVRRAAAMAKAERSELTLVHVAVPPPAWAGVGMLAMPLVEDVEAMGCELVRRTLDELPDDIAVRWHLVSGPEACGGISRARCVRRALRCVLERGGHDVLVLGTGVRPGRIAGPLARALPDCVIAVPYAAPEGVAAGSAPQARSVLAK